MRLASLKYIFLLLVFFYIAKFFYESYSDLQTVRIEIAPVYFILSCLFLILFYCILVSLWYFLTIVTGCRITFEKSVISWFYSQLGKYVPGKVFTVASRIYFYNKDGISPKKVSLCFYLETMASLLGSTLICVSSALHLNLPLFKNYRSIIYILLGVIFILIHPKIISRVSSIGMTLFKRPPVRIEIKYFSILIIVIFYSLNYLLLGLGFFCLIRSVYSLHPSYIFLISGSYAMASIIGFLSFFAPSGLGVREGVLIYVLRNIMPDSIAGIISIFSRVWVTIVELSLVALVFCYAKLRRITFKI